MTTQSIQSRNEKNIFDFFANQIIAPAQLRFIKGGEDLDGDGIDDDGNGVVGTVDIVSF